MKWACKTVAYKAIVEEAIFRSVCLSPFQFLKQGFLLYSPLIFSPLAFCLTPNEGKL